MKEISVVSFCDGDHEDRVRSSVERVMSVDGSKPVALDLCDECDGLVSRLLQLMDRGVVVKPPAAKKKSSSAPTEGTKAPTPRPNTKFHKPTGELPPLEGPHICPECGFESKSRNALGQHLTVTHSKRFRDYANAANAA